MNVLEAISKRTSCRCFKEIPVSDEDLEKVLEAGVKAPTAHNTQAYKLIVVKDSQVKEVSEKILEELNLYSKYGIPLGSAKRSARILRDAPVNIFVFIKKNSFFRLDKVMIDLPEEYMKYVSDQNEIQSIISAGTVIENMLLEAEELNLGAVCISEITYAKDFCNKYFDGVIDMNEYEFASSVALGFREDVLYPKAKKKGVDELVVTM